jgi:hypothetical protein
LGKITRIFGGKSPDVRRKSAKHPGKITEHVTLKMWEVGQQEIGGVHHHGRIQKCQGFDQCDLEFGIPTGMEDYTDE